MKKSDFVNLLSSKIPTLSIQEITLIFDKFLEAIILTLTSDSKVELREFGSFYLRNYKISSGTSKRSFGSTDNCFAMKKSSYKRIYFRAGKNFINKTSDSEM